MCCVAYLPTTIPIAITMNYTKGLTPTQSMYYVTVNMSEYLLFYRVNKKGN